MVDLNHCWDGEAQVRFEQLNPSFFVRCMSLFDKVHRLSRVLTPLYCQIINSEIVHPVSSIVVKPHELRSSLSRPLHVIRYEPERDVAFLAATLCYGLIQGVLSSGDHLTTVSDTIHHITLGHPFMDGNKRTTFVIANEYSKLLGLRGLRYTLSEKDIEQVVATWVSVAKGEMDTNELAKQLSQYFG